MRQRSRRRLHRCPGAGTSGHAGHLPLLFALAVAVFTNLALTDLGLACVCIHRHFRLLGSPATPRLLRGNDRHSRCRSRHNRPTVSGGEGCSKVTTARIIPRVTRLRKSELGIRYRLSIRSRHRQGRCGTAPKCTTLVLAVTPHALTIRRRILILGLRAACALFFCIPALLCVTNKGTPTVSTRAVRRRMCMPIADVGEADALAIRGLTLGSPLVLSLAHSRAFMLARRLARGIPSLT